MNSIKSLTQALTHTGNFSAGAARALARYVCDTGSEGNIIDICESFTEHASMMEAAEFYGFPPDYEGSQEDACEWLEGQTLVIEFVGGVVVSRF